MSEIEIKLTHSNPDVLRNALNDPLLMQASLGTVQTIRMHSAYYDTAAQDLYTAGCGLRFRTENDRGVVTLKVDTRGNSANGLTERGEFEVSADSLAGGLDALCAVASDHAALLAHAAPQLTQIAAVTFTREERHVCIDGTEIAVSADFGWFNNDPNCPFAEFEAELKHGSVETLLSVCDTLTQAYGLVPLADSKLKRALAHRR